MPATSQRRFRFHQVAAWLATALVCLLTVAGPVIACPTCKDGIAQHDPSQQAMATGYFYSIIFMLSMPFLILGTFGSFAYFTIRNAQARQERDADDFDRGT